MHRIVSGPDANPLIGMTILSELHSFLLTVAMEFDAGPVRFSFALRLYNPDHPNNFLNCIDLMRRNSRLALAVCRELSFSAAVVASHSLKQSQAKPRRTSLIPVFV